MAQHDEIQAALKTWRDGLVGLTRQSSLIKFRAPKSSSLLIDVPSPDLVLEGLRSGRPQSFRGDLLSESQDRRQSPPPPNVFRSPRPDGEVGTVVRGIMRRAQTLFLDRGLNVLYIAFGMLDWRDLDGTEMVSPLLLVPVDLLPVGPRETPQVTEGEDDAVLNPALALRLREFGIDFPTPEEIEGLSVGETFAAVRSALAKHRAFSEWKLRDTTYLGMFSFTKEAMFRDLLENEAAILEHPIVRALAISDPAKQSGEFQFDPIDPADIETFAPPEDTPLVLDADTSQRVAIAAAVKGHSFVMDGPPGTGKSQTIANMIGALLHSGKSVLFVSEKVAALDVVRNRLAAAGLGSYLLELHSHKATRKEVAIELLKTLDNVARPPSPMPSPARLRVKGRRQQLNEYAAAMNQICQPLNSSLHQVLGQYAALTEAPIAPVPEKAPVDLSEAQYASIQETLGRLVRVWRPAAQGNSFLWRDVVDESSLEVRLYQAESALDELRGTVTLNTRVVEVFNLTRPSDASRLHALTAHQHLPHPEGIPEHWLTVSSTEALEQARAALGRELGALRASEAAVADAARVPWTAFPDATEIAHSPEPVKTSTARAVDLDELTVSQLIATADQFEADARMLNERIASLSALATNLGLLPVTRFSEVDRLNRLVELRADGARPDHRWFAPGGLAAARANAANLQQQAQALDEAQARASSTFTPDALSAPLDDLQDRFTNLHKGLKKLSGNYRADKRVVAALLTEAADVKSGITHLADAVAWAQESSVFEGLSSTLAGSLGSYWKGRETDYVSLNAALDIAEQVLALTNNEPPTQLVDFICAPDQIHAPRAIVETARGDIEGWTRGLLPHPAVAGRPELLFVSVDEAVDWLTQHVGPMRQAADRVAAVNAATGRDDSLSYANRLLRLVHETWEAKQVLEAAAPVHRQNFDHFFASDDTDLAVLDEALEWAMGLRALAGGALTAEQVEVLAGSHVVEAVPSTYEKWVRARDRVVDAFGTSRRAELLAELDEYDDAIGLIQDLRTDTVGQQEWFEYRQAYEQLSEHGLDAVVDFCIEQHVGEEEVGNVVNRALLRGWSDAVIQGDGRLRPLLATDRDALVEEYRTLDRELVRAATADIIRAANARRPVNTTAGESATIRREGGKQKKHRAVRDLMAATRTVTTAIKPVFMMSPLAVSQYLPSDMQFDVVIFDEASQVTPGDAINCIYRGKSLILAGDDKQLPPTSFFERTTDDEDEEQETDVKDFQSVLELAKAAAAFNNLGLRWHYRSRHEDLIAFSNYKFYEGKLVTFPSAHVDGNDVGVEFFHAQGTYRRGGGAINPVEAAKVAERVIDHFTNRPHLTLGVVTFSVAQSDAVQNAIDEARVSRRDLDSYFDTDDRLDGFFIRALEQVQGDERDVIIFSVGYGPDEAGRISTNFGALNKAKGWRRLNVGITRAKQRVEVVASMRAGQIPPSTNENVEYFRAYLDYAERGQKTLAVPYAPTGLDPESPFEESVISVIRGWGFTVEPQVGAAGFRIDIGVRHPDYPGMFALGVECDGYQYHSAPAARDRDRLRDQVLIGLGWRLHRIWGTAWYRDRAPEEKRLRAAIEEAIAAPVEARTVPPPVVDHPVVKLQRAGTNLTAPWATEYSVARMRKLPYWVDPGEPGSHLHMVEPIRDLVQHEGPVHLEIALERLRAGWGIGRVGPNIRSNIELAIEHAEVLHEDDFLSFPGEDVPHVRVPTSRVSRKVQHVHLEELALAAHRTIEDVGGASRVEAVQAVARTFGWARTGAIVERRINEAIDQAVERGWVVESGGTLSRAREE